MEPARPPTSRSAGPCALVTGCSGEPPPNHGLSGHCNCSKRWHGESAALFLAAFARSGVVFGAPADLR